MEFINKTVKELALESELREVRSELEYYKRMADMDRVEFSPTLNAKVESIETSETVFRRAAIASAKFQYEQGRIVFHGKAWDRRNGDRVLEHTYYASEQALKEHIRPEDALVDIHKRLVFDLVSMSRRGEL